MTDNYLSKIAEQVDCLSDKNIEAIYTALFDNPLFDIEASSVCNANCIFCPREMYSSKTIMTPDTFEHVLDLLPHNATVMFSGFGEPLINPHIESFVEKLLLKNISSCVITNGLILTPNRQKQLIKAGIRQFQISLNAADPDLWNVMTGLDHGFFQVMENLKYLSKNRTQDLRVNLNFVRSPNNINEEPKVRYLAQQFGFDFYTRRQHTRGGEIGIPRKTHPVCGIFAAVTFIGSDGFLRSCVNDVRRQTQLCHISNTTWSDIISWKGKMLSEGLFPLCSKCDDDYRFVILHQKGVE